MLALSSAHPCKPGVSTFIFLAAWLPRFALIHRITVKNELYHSLLDQLGDVDKVVQLQQMLVTCNWHQNYSAQPLYQQGLNSHQYATVNATLQDCQVEGGQLQVHHLFRFGPFNSIGGLWNRIRFAPFDPFDPSSTADLGSSGLVSLTSYFMGATSLDHSVIGYPPLHIHHFHLEQQKCLVGLCGAVITHGDDQCTTADGGVACLVRKMPDGFATKIKRPFLVSSEINDVRESTSLSLPFWFTIALQTPRTRIHLRPFSQHKVVLQPVDARYFVDGDAVTYGVPSDRTSGFFRSGYFVRQATYFWSYYHTHPQWLSDMFLLTGANASEFQKLVQLPQDMASGNLVSLTRDQVHTLRSRINFALARDTKLRLRCHYMHDNVPFDIVFGTAQANSRFYRRKPESCSTFAVTGREPFVAIVLTKPDSIASMKTTRNLTATMHSFIRLFTSLQDIDEPLVFNERFL